jgi:hypothetical protein
LKHRFFIREIPVFCDTHATDDWKYNNFTETVLYTCTWRYWYEEFIGSIIHRCYNEGVHSKMDDANIQAGFSVQRV